MRCLRRRLRGTAIVRSRRLLRSRGRWKLPINHDFADIETASLAKLVMSGNYAGRTVLICWHHGEIPHLAAAFGVVGAPKHWDEEVFDKVWQITWVDGVATLKILVAGFAAGGFEVARFSSGRVDALWEAPLQDLAALRRCLAETFPVGLCELMVRK